MGWIFASIVLILLVVSPGFRRTAGGIVAVLIGLFVVVYVQGYYEEKAEAEAARIEAANHEPDPCKGNIDCLLSELEDLAER